MKSYNNAAVSLADRLEFGFLTLDEVCSLKNCGRTQIYSDIKAGALEFVKHGRSTRIPGPAAKSYIPGARHSKTRAA